MFSLDYILKSFAYVSEKQQLLHLQYKDFSLN